MPSKANDSPTAGTASRSSGDFETTLAALGKKADEARAKLAEMPDEAAKAASRQLQKANKATQAKLRELQKGWQAMEPKKKAQVIAGVLGAIAAITIPVVVAKKRKAKKVTDAAGTAKPGAR
jgi:F0F1-type ATP synthase membrane subunit b/b'